MELAFICHWGRCLFVRMPKDAGQIEGNGEMKKELLRTIICMIVGFLMLWLMFGCSQHDQKLTVLQFESSTRTLNDGEGADSRQPGIFGNLGRGAK